MSASTTDKITDVRNAARPNSARVSTSRVAGGTNLACNSLIGWPTASKVHFVTYQIDSNSNPISSTQLDCTGIVVSNTLTNVEILDGTDGGNAVGDVVEMLPTAAWGQDLADALLVTLERTGTLKDDIVTTSKILDSAVTTAKIAAANVTLAKLESAVQTKVGYLSAPDSGWTVPTYTNSWTNYDTTYGPAAYYKDALGFVHLRGLIKSGTVGQSAFTLPVGYRPSVRTLFASMSADVICRIDVVTDGTVFMGTGCNNAWVSLNNISFKAV